MIPIVQIKKDLNYNNNLKSVIEILKLIATSEFAKVSENAPKEDDYNGVVIDCFSMLPRVKELSFKGEEKLKQAYLLVCSDEGFLGEVNTRVVNAALAELAGEKAEFIVLGERGQSLLRESGVESAMFGAVANDIDMGHAQKVASHIMELYRSGVVRTCKAVYVKFRSFTHHQTVSERLLPCGDVVTDARGLNYDKLDTIIEPDTNAIGLYLTKMWLENSIYNIFWSSKLSEWAIKIMRLESASDELKEITTKLRFQYFKALHALSDKSIREIFAAHMAG